MINPKELRIGNFVFPTQMVNRIRFPITSIPKQIGDLNDFDCKLYFTDKPIPEQEIIHRARYSEIEPIPITEEWLVKLGFEKAANGYWDSECEFRVYPSGVDIMYLGELIPCPETKYIHQLQNLYYALTGNELTINQKP